MKHDRSEREVPLVKMDIGPKRNRMSAAPNNSRMSVARITESAERSVTIALEIKFVT